MLMETANIMLALGGNKNNTVPKFFVTPSEIAVLREIHGNESVTDIEPTGSVQRSNNAERERLAAVYGAHDGEKFVSRAVNRLFPGAAARVFERIDDLSLDESFFKPTARAKVPNRSAPIIAPSVPDDPAPEDPQDGDDEIEDMPSVEDDEPKRGAARKGGKAKTIFD